MRQFSQVSISPWANPYNGAVNTGQSYYTASAPKSPYRRIVAPAPLPARFLHPGVEQVIDDSDDESGGAPVDSVAPPSAPEPPQALEAPEAPVSVIPPLPPPPSPPPPEFAEIPEAPVLNAPPLPPPPSAPPPEVAEDTPADDSPHELSQSEIVVVPDDEASSKDSAAIIVDVKNEPLRPAEANIQETSAETAVIGPPPPPPPPPPAEDVAESIELPPPPPPPAEDVFESSKTHLPPPPAEVRPEPSVAESEKSGEADHNAPHPPKAPVEKFVHFTSDTKEADASGGKKKKKLLIGKGKVNAFVRIKNPPSPASTPLREEKNKVLDKIIKSRERRPSILSVSSIEKPVVKEESPAPKKKPSKADERKQKKQDEKDKKAKGKKSKTKSGSPISRERAVREDADSMSEVAGSVVSDETVDTQVDATGVALAPLPPPPPAPCDETPRDDHDTTESEDILPLLLPPPPPCDEEEIATAEPVGSIEDSEGSEASHDGVPSSVPSAEEDSESDEGRTVDEASSAVGKAPSDDLPVSKEDYDQPVEHVKTEDNAQVGGEAPLGCDGGLTEAEHIAIGSVAKPVKDHDDAVKIDTAASPPSSHVGSHAESDEDSEEESESNESSVADSHEPDEQCLRANKSPLPSGTAVLSEASAGSVDSEEAIAVEVKPETIDVQSDSGEEDEEQEAEGADLGLSEPIEEATKPAEAAGHPELVVEQSVDVSTTPESQPIDADAELLHQESTDESDTSEAKVPPLHDSKAEPELVASAESGGETAPVSELPEIDAMTRNNEPAREKPRNHIASGDTTRPVAAKTDKQETLASDVALAREVTVTAKEGDANDSSNIAEDVAHGSELSRAEQDPRPEDVPHVSDENDLPIESPPPADVALIEDPIVASIELTEAEAQDDWAPSGPSKKSKNKKKGKKGKNATTTDPVAMVKISPESTAVTGEAPDKQEHVLEEIATSPSVDSVVEESISEHMPAESEARPYPIDELDGDGNEDEGANLAVDSISAIIGEDSNLDLGDHLAVADNEAAVAIAETGEGSDVAAVPSMSVAAAPNEQEPVSDISVAQEADDFLQHGAPTVKCAEKEPDDLTLEPSAHEHPEETIATQPEEDPTLDAHDQPDIVEMSETPNMSLPAVELDELALDNDDAPAGDDLTHRTALGDDIDAKLKDTPAVCQEGDSMDLSTESDTANTGANGTEHDGACSPDAEEATSASDSDIYVGTAVETAIQLPEDPKMLFDDNVHVHAQEEHIVTGESQAETVESGIADAPEQPTSDQAQVDDQNVKDECATVDFAVSRSSSLDPASEESVLKESAIEDEFVTVSDTAALKELSSDMTPGQASDLPTEADDVTHADAPDAQEGLDVDLDTQDADSDLVIKSSTLRPSENVPEDSEVSDMDDSDDEVASGLPAPETEHGAVLADESSPESSVDDPNEISIESSNAVTEGETTSLSTAKEEQSDVSSGDGLEQGKTGAADETAETPVTDNSDAVTGDQDISEAQDHSPLAREVVPEDDAPAEEEETSCQSEALQEDERAVPDITGDFETTNQENESPDEHLEAVKINMVDAEDHAPAKETSKVDLPAANEASKDLMQPEAAIATLDVEIMVSHDNLSSEKTPSDVQANEAAADEEPISEGDDLGVESVKVAAEADVFDVSDEPAGVAAEAHAPPPVAVDELISETATESKAPAANGDESATSAGEDSLKVDDTAVAHDDHDQTSRQHADEEPLLNVDDMLAVDISAPNEPEPVEQARSLEVDATDEDPIEPTTQESASKVSPVPDDMQSGTAAVENLSDIKGNVPKDAAADSSPDGEVQHPLRDAEVGAPQNSDQDEGVEVSADAVRKAIVTANLDEHALGTQLTEMEAVVEKAQHDLDVVLDTLPTIATSPEEHLDVEMEPCHEPIAGMENTDVSESAIHKSTSTDAAQSSHDAQAVANKTAGPEAIQRADVDDSSPVDVSLGIMGDVPAPEGSTVGTMVENAPPEHSTEFGETIHQPVIPHSSETPNAEFLGDISVPKTRDFAIMDGPATESPRERQQRRHSHRDSRHPRRRDSEASTKERPTLGGLAAGVLAAAKLAASTKSKRQNSMTERDMTRGKERTRESNKENSNSSKERMHPEHGSHRHRDRDHEDKHSKRRTLEGMEEDAERRRRRERHAEKAPVGVEDHHRSHEAGDAKEQEHQRRERRRAAKQTEDERLRREEIRFKKEEDARLAKEDEERRIRHAERRKRHEAEKEARRLERERAEQAERDGEEAKQRRRQRRAEREKGKMSAPRPIREPDSPPRGVSVELPRDSARRAFEEDDEVTPSPMPTTPPPPAMIPESPPRSAPRRHMSTRGLPPTTKRNSILGGLFARSNTDPVITPPKSVKPVARVRSDPLEVPASPVRALRTEKERPKSSHQSSNDSRDRVERPHHSRRHSQRQREFRNPDEEAEYYRQKEKRRSARHKEHEMSGGRDGGISLMHAEAELPPPPEPCEPDRSPDSPRDLREFEPMIDDAAAELGVASTSSTERRERRRSKRASGIEERPKSRRITVSERERPVSRRHESDRPRTRGHDEERPRTRTRRSDTEKRSSGAHRSSKKEEPNGLKSLFGGLKKRIG